MRVNFHKKVRKWVRGFTLIELLIVITIVGVLSVAFLPRLVGGTAKARDTRRQRDLAVIYQGLQSWSIDHGNIYPGYLYLDPGGGGGNIPSHLCASELGDAVRELEKYIQKMPTGPKRGFNWKGAAECTDGGYEYMAIQGGKGFLLIAEMELTSQTGDHFYESSTFEPDLEQDLADILDSATPCSEGDCVTNGTMYMLSR